MSRSLYAAIAILLVALAWPALALAGPQTLIIGVDNPKGFEPTGTLDGSAPPFALGETIDTLGGAVTHCYTRARICIVELPPNTLDDANALHTIDALRALPGVRYVETDYLLPPPTSPRIQKDDANGTPECSDLWELDTVRAREAWAIADGTNAPIIAIQDTGFLLTHEELIGRISGQYDYGNGDTYPEVEWGSTIPDHGTFIAAMIVGDPDNGHGRAGLAPYARVNLQKIADNTGALYFSYAVAAMADLADGDLGVRVLNYSIGTPTATQAFRDAVEALDNVGILLVAAAGNCSVAHCSNANNDVYPMFPGSYTFEHVLTVAGSTQTGYLNTYSHYGANSVDLAAPGVALCSAGAHANDNYYTAGGTSYATPLVAAAAALVFEAHPITTPTEVARVLRVSASPSPDLVGKVRSGGILDAAAALQTPIPRFRSLRDREIDGEATMDLTVENVGHAGDACMVISHPDAVEIVAAHNLMTDTCWNLQVATPAGDTVSLPDAGTVAIQQDRLTTICGPIASHTSPILRLTVRGRTLGQWPVAVRFVLSNGTNYLNAPYKAGVTDVTGFLAWPTTWDVTATSQSTDNPCAGIPMEDIAPDADTSAPGEDTASPDSDGFVAWDTIDSADGVDDILLSDGKNDSIKTDANTTTDGELTADAGDSNCGCRSVTSHRTTSSHGGLVALAFLIGLMRIRRRRPAQRS